MTRSQEGTLQICTAVERKSQRRALARRLGVVLLGGMVFNGALTDAAHAQSQAAAPENCAVKSSSNVRVEGMGMLRLGDVAGCPGLRYEIIPGVRINGQPAVRLLPNEDGTGGGGAASVTADGKAVGRQGDQQ